jgi:hypothetical protein
MRPVWIELEGTSVYAIGCEIWPYKMIVEDHRVGRFTAWIGILDTIFEDADLVIQDWQRVKSLYDSSYIWYTYVSVLPYSHEAQVRCVSGLIAHSSAVNKVLTDACKEAVESLR